jgi:hypothetical protein
MFGLNPNNLLALSSPLSPHPSPLPGGERGNDETAAKRNFAAFVFAQSLSLFTNINNWLIKNFLNNAKLGIVAIVF